MRSKVVRVLVVLFAWPLVATANVILQYGGSAGIGIRDCSVAPGCSNEGNLPTLAFQQVTAPNLPGVHIDTTGFSAYDASLATGLLGQQTFWNGSYSGSFGVPTVRAAAYTANSRVSDGGWLLQSYTWDGTGSATRTISGTLTFSASGGFPDFGGGGFYVGMSIFTTGTNTAVLLESRGCGYGGLTFDLGYTCIQNADVLASNEGSLNDPTTNGTFDLNLPSITFDSPGETIFLLMSLVGFAKAGGFGDASHTFMATFDNQTGLTPGVVPEPATLALLGLALAGLYLSRSRA